MKRAIGVVWLALCVMAAPALSDGLAPRAICENFIKAVKAGKYEKPAVDKVLEKWEVEKKAKTVAPDSIREAFKVLSLDYRRALVMIRGDQLDDAAAMLEEVTKKAKKAGDKFLLATAQLHWAGILVRGRNWDYAEAKLKTLRGSGELADFVLPKRKIEMLAARTFARVGRIDEAIEIAKKLADTEEGRRLLARLEVERDGATLDDVHQEMDKVKGDLDAAKSGRDTRNKQDKIIAMLDALIEEAEENEQGGGGGGGGGGGSSEAEGEGSGSGSGPPSGTGTPSSPATMSALPGGPSTDPGKKASTATVGDVWMKLSTKQRAKVLDALRQRFPRRYGELIREYYKALAEGESK